MTLRDKRSRREGQKEGFPTGSFEKVTWLFKQYLTHNLQACCLAKLDIIEAHTADNLSYVLVDYPSKQPDLTLKQYLTENPTP